MYDLIGDDEAGELDDWDRRSRAIDRLREIVEAQVAELRAHRPTLDYEGIARDRLGAADRAKFDPSKEALLARKYEAATERALFRTLKEYREVEAEAGSLGSFSPDDPAAEVEGRAARSKAPSGRPRSARMAPPAPSATVRSVPATPQAGAD